MRFGSRTESSQEQVTIEREGTNSGGLVGAKDYSLAKDRSTLVNLRMKRTDPIMEEDRKDKTDSQNPASLKTLEVVQAWIGGFIGIAVLGYVHFNVPDRWDSFMLISAFGSSAVLVFGDRESPSSQPRSLIGGHVLSAFVGVLAYKIFHDAPWLAASVGTATAIAVMKMTTTLHPPGGASALIAVIGTDRIHDLGFLYVIAPVGLGALTLLLLALVVNNIPKNGRYPVTWFQ